MNDMFLVLFFVSLLQPYDYLARRIAKPYDYFYVNTPKFPVSQTDVLRILYILFFTAK